MDAYVSEIVVVLSGDVDGRFENVCDDLCKQGLQVTTVNKDEAVVEGVIETEFVPKLQALKDVDYVRVVFTYAANFPKGDPRDRDGV